MKRKLYFQKKRFQIIALTALFVFVGCSKDETKNSDTVGVTITETTVIFPEDGSGSIDIVLNSEPNADVAINVISADTTEAVAGTTQAIFNAKNWNTKQTILLNGVKDHLADANRTIDFNITIDSTATKDTTGYANLTLSAVSVTVQDIDQVGVTVIETATTLFENSNGELQVVLNTIPDGPVSITVTTSDITEALVSADGGATTANTITLTFDANNWNQIQTVTIVGQEDAGSIDGNTNINIAVELDAGNTTDTSGYAALASTPISTVATQVLDNNSITVSTLNHDVAIIENGAVGSFDIVLNSAPDGDVVVVVDASDVTEFQVNKTPVGEPSWSLNYAFTTADWSTPKTVYLIPMNDNEIDGPQSVQAALSIDAVNTTDTTGYAALTAGDISDVAVTVNDDDAPGLAIVAESYTVSDTGSAGFVAFTLATIPDGDVVITLTSNDTTEMLVDPNDSGSPAASASIKFTSSDWDTMQFFALEGQPDNVVDGDKTAGFTITVDQALTTDTTGYKSFNPAAFLSASNVTATDTDTVALNVSPTAGVVNEGATRDVNFVLNTIPDGNVYVTVSVNPQDDTELLLKAAADPSPVNSTTIVFTPEDWSTNQNIRLYGQVDNTVDGNQIKDITVQIDTINTTDSTGYADLSNQTLQFNVVDVDTAGITVTPKYGLSIAEGSETFIGFTVVLNTIPSNAGSVVIQYCSDDASELSAENPFPNNYPECYEVTRQATQWQTPVTVLFWPMLDNIVDGNQTPTLTVKVFTAHASTTAPEYQALTDGDAKTFTATVSDVNAIGMTVSTLSKTTIWEQDAANTSTFTVNLNTVPDGVVVLDVASDSTTAKVSTTGNAADAASSTQLTFNAADWSTTQTITIHPVDNVTADGNATANVSVTPNAASTMDTTGYKFLSASSQSITVSDDESIITMFVTSTKHTGDLTVGGFYADPRTGADALAASGAPAVCSGKTVRAFISIDAADSISAMPANYGVPTNYAVVSPTYQVIGSNWADLLDDVIPDTMINLGATTEVTFYWTGSDSAGNSTGVNCNGWTDNTIGGTIGQTNVSTPFSWLNTGAWSCGAAIVSLIGICY